MINTVIGMAGLAIFLAYVLLISEGGMKHPPYCNHSWCGKVLAHVFFTTTIGSAGAIVGALLHLIVSGLVSSV